MIPPCIHLFSSASGNRKVGGGKQGRGNQPPYRRYGPDTEVQYRPRKPHELAKPSRILSKSEADTEFQCRPHIVDMDTIADPVFADAISETSDVGRAARVDRTKTVRPQGVLLEGGSRRLPSQKALGA